MVRLLAVAAAIVIGVYVILVGGCIFAHQPDDVSMENPPSNEEIGRSMMAVTCLIPQPTLWSLGLSFAYALAVGYFGLNEGAGLGGGRGGGW